MLTFFKNIKQLRNWFLTKKEDSLSRCVRPKQYLLVSAGLPGPNLAVNSLKRPNRQNEKKGQIKAK
jgi:hypothetical protein